MLSFMKDVLGLILGGGAGSRLYPLTKLRAKPAVPLAGLYRLIDIPISNCINSGIKKMYVLTQYSSVSLHRHVVRTYQFDTFNGGWVQILAAEQTHSNLDWYEGTADALRKQLYQIQVQNPHDVLILSGDHLYRMDYAKFVQFHNMHEADITIAVKPVSAGDAIGKGILKADETNRITNFAEKPPADKLSGMESNDSDTPYLASMGIYVFRTDTLVKELRAESGSDFGFDIIPAAIEKGLKVYAYPFDYYWADIGTIKSFYDVNLALATAHPPFDFFSAEWPIYTRPRYLSGSRVIDSSLTQVLLAPGCSLEKAAIDDSVIGLRSIINSGAHLHRVVMMGADDYETQVEIEDNLRAGIPNVGVGRGTVIENAILDKSVRIGRNVVIRNHAGMPDEENDMYVIRDGIVVIPKNTIIPDGTII